MGEILLKAGSSDYWKQDATNVLLIDHREYKFDGSFDDGIEEYNFNNADQAPVIAVYRPSEFTPQIIFYFGSLAIIRNGTAGFSNEYYNGCVSEYKQTPTSDNPFTHDITYYTWQGIDALMNGWFISSKNYLSPEENSYNIGQLIEGRDYEQFTSVYLNNIPIYQPDENNVIDITREDLYMGCSYKNGRFYSVPFNEEDPYTDSTADDDGGHGTPDWNSDPIRERALPPDFYGNSGLVKVYTPTSAELQALSNYLWSDAFDVESFKKIVNNPFDLILALNYIPFLTTSGGSREINVGNIVDTGLTMTYPSQENYRHDFGYITLNEDENAFIDYSPYTRVSIHLPFIGTQAIDIDLLRRNSKYNDTSFKLVYKYNIVNGSVVAYLYTANQKVLYEWAGNVATPIPVATNDFSNMFGGLASLATSAVSGAISGGMIGSAVPGIGTAVGAVAGGVAGMAQGGLNTVASLKPNITTTGSVGSSASLLTSTNDAFILVEQPPLSIPHNYQGKLLGYPRNKSGIFKESKGYNELASIRIGSKKATETERTEIYNILTSGYVYGDSSGVNSLPTLPADADGVFTIGLYQTNSSNNRVDKSLDAVSDYTHVNIKDSTSIIAPIVTMNMGNNNAIKANYCYIPAFERFYYIVDKTCLRGNLWQLTLRCDVLMSFRKSFVDNEVIFKRSQYGYNLYLNDGSIQVDSRTRIKVKKFPNSLTNDGTYVMLMAGS